MGSALHSNLPLKWGLELCRFLPRLSFCEDVEVRMGVLMLPLQAKKMGDPKLTPTELYVCPLRPRAREQGP